MQIQGTGEIGPTKRKFHLFGVPRIESRLYIWKTIFLEEKTLLSFFRANKTYFIISYLEIMQDTYQSLFLSSKRGLFWW